MKKLKSTEVILSGSWIYQSQEMIEDNVCKRIKWLTNNHLQKIKDSPQWGGWETLYRDPDDGRYWERTYPHGEMQGGGAPQLRFLNDRDAKDKYDLSF